jgi:Flp pilus assembly protein TadG
MVECAIVFPLACLLLFGLIIGGLGVFRYQEMAHLAREAARYASVHGALYAQETGKPAATDQDVYDNVILPNAFTLDPNQLNYSVTWNTDNQPSHTANGKQVTNTVTVTVSYQWYPGLYLTGPITLSSTSTVPMSY